MLTARAYHDHAHGAPQGQVSLDYDGRFLRRKMLTTDAGEAFLVDLAQTVSLNHGGVLRLEDGREIEVIAAPEDLLEVRGTNLLQLAWHIGNRHTPCQIETERLLIQRDHVIRDMLQKLGAELRQVVEPFTPEGGAYGHGGPMATPTDAAILTLTQWLSPAYPVGGFAYSHGLEAAIDAGTVASAPDAGAWITDVLEHGSGRADTLLLAAAYRAENPAELAETDAAARAFCASAERLKETGLLGQAFGTVTGDVWALELAGLAYPVAVGRAARLQDLPLLLTAQMFLQGFAANLVAVATRLVPLGQTDAQRLIRDLTPLCAEIARQTQQGRLEDLSATAFLSDIASMQHETQYSRIFRT